MKNDSAFAVQQHGPGLRVVRIKRTADARWQVLDRIEDPSGALPNGKIARAMAAEAAKVAWMLPGDEVKTFVTPFPRLGAKDLARAAAGWVAREEGGRPGDWALTWKALGSQGESATNEQQDLFLLYTSREIVDREIADAAAGGIKPRLMLPAYAVLDQFFRRFGPGADDLGVWNIVFLGEKENFLSISTRDSLLMTRSLPADLSEGENPKEYLGRLATEIDRSVSFARQTEHSPNVEKILVCGDPERARDLVALMDEEVSTPAGVWNLSEYFAGSVDADAGLLPALAAAALADVGCELDLGPGRGLRLMGPRVRRRALLAAGAAGVALVPLLLVGGMVTTGIQENYLERARVRMEASAEQARIARETYEAQRVMLARQQRIRRFTEKNPDFRSVLLNIADLTPKQVVYEDLRIRELPDGRFFLHLEGAATANSAQRAQQAFLELLHALNSCEFLSGAREPRSLEITALDRADTRRKSAVFSMEYQLLPPGALQEDRS